MIITHQQYKNVKKCFFCSHLNYFDSLIVHKFSSPKNSIILGPLYSKTHFLKYLERQYYLFIEKIILKFMMENIYPYLQSANLNLAHWQTRQDSTIGSWLFHSKPCLLNQWDYWQLTWHWLHNQVIPANLIFHLPKVNEKVWIQVI